MLFNKRTGRALVFVDYEHWLVSYDKQFHLRPDLISWKEEILQQYPRAEFYFFADFTNERLQTQVIEIRAVTNHIIETRNATLGYKKDMTDFIMLDYIYQMAMDKHAPNTFILFTGDGHFQSVVKFLIARCKKQVIVYGVRDAFSNQLKAVATRWIEMPTTGQTQRGYYQMIINNLDYVARHPKRRIISTFKGTVQTVADYNGVKAPLIEEALQEMLNKGYVYTQKMRVGPRRSVSVLAANWALLERDGLYRPAGTLAGDDSRQSRRDRTNGKRS